MSDQAVTFDFHNTLVACPAWFDLEVLHLPSSFLRWWSDRSGTVSALDSSADADLRYQRLRREIIEHGNELTAEACLQAVFAEMGIAIPSAEVAAGVEHLMRQLLASASPIPGAVETVRALGHSGVPIGVVSSAVYHPFLEWTLDAFGMLGSMQMVITSASAGYYKSRPELYLLAAERLGTDPPRVVHVGDSLRFDVGGASRVGMGTVWLQHDSVTTSDHSFTPDLTLRTLEGSAPLILDLLVSRANHRPGHKSHAGT